MNIRAFVSYASVTEEADVGWVGSVCKRLEQEVNLLTGLTLTILYDKRDIKWGQQWRDFVVNAPKSAMFLIAILTVPYFTSEPCREEYEAFLTVEKEQSRNDLILPILYVDVSSSSWISDPRVDRWRKDLLGRQYVDLINLRHNPISNPEFKKVISMLAEKLKSRIETMQFSEEHQDVSNSDGALVPSGKYAQSDPKGSQDGDELPLVKVVGRPLDEQSRIDEFRKLPGTQKDVMHYIYREMYRTEISVEELFDRLHKKYGPKKIESIGELYYRLRVLELLHLLRLKSLGRQATNVVRDNVMEALITEEDLFAT